MSNIQYRADVTINENPQNGQQNGSLVAVPNLPVRSFSVVGGTSRSIDLDSADEISIGNEFEQIRTYRNVTLFIPPSKDFTAVKLVTLRSSGLKFFTLAFTVDIYADGKRTQTLTFASSKAWLAKNPIPVGNKEALLMMEVHFDSGAMLHGKLNKRTGEFVHKQI